MDEEKLTGHEKAELKRQEKEAERLTKESTRENKQTFSFTIKIVLTIVVFGGIGYWLLTTSKTEAPFATQPIHWHAKLEMEICGKIMHLPRTGAGEHHKGLPLLHTHDDDLIHVEGQPMKEEDIMLGRFMDAIEVPFDKDKFFDKKNGDICDNTGKPGTLKIYINEKESDLFRDYVSKNGDTVKLVFE